MSRSFNTKSQFVTFSPKNGRSQSRAEKMRQAVARYNRASTISKSAAAFKEMERASRDVDLDRYVAFFGEIE